MVNGLEIFAGRKTLSYLSLIDSRQAFKVGYQINRSDWNGSYQFLTLNWCIISLSPALMYLLFKNEKRSLRINDCLGCLVKVSGYVLHAIAPLFHLCDDLKASVINPLRGRVIKVQKHCWRENHSKMCDLKRGRSIAFVYKPQLT
jgi:hypothetical protein